MRKNHSDGFHVTIEPISLLSTLPACIVRASAAIIKALMKSITKIPTIPPKINNTPINGQINRKIFDLYSGSIDIGV